MKKILVLTDFSVASRHALQFARSFFSDTAADFHLLYPHLADPDGIEVPDFVAEMTHLTYAAGPADTAAGLPGQPSADWHTFRSSNKLGQPMAMVEQSVAQEVYDLVVVGPHETSSDDLFGNSAITLIRLLKANVLVVPANIPVKAVEQVVLAVDFARLTNLHLLDPVKELVLLKGAVLTLLSIATPDKKVVNVTQETQIRQYLSPIDPTVAHIQAPSAKQGIDAYLESHPVDLLVTMPKYNGHPVHSSGNSHVRARAFSPHVLLLTIYDGQSGALPHHIEDLSNLDFAL
ncbi:universal stress protein [Fibrella aquatilis]|uniref:Universal stress protein n=1 Tax=Fibrella aquatilis TaxID=2817059 RepID=A0A939G5S8_9BACT|nr:universal stress protein [Fibrella aquatilis]MBO0930303.1 universal stress protein [Fibrella aquatilis]